MNMVFCKDCGLWINETPNDDDETADYCAACQKNHPSVWKRLLILVGIK